MGVEDPVITRARREQQKKQRAFESKINAMLVEFDIIKKKVSAIEKRLSREDRIYAKGFGSERMI
jgi:hypothetical protein